MGIQQSQFPYEVGEATSTNHQWSLHQGVRKEDGSRVSIFIFDKVKPDLVSPHTTAAANMFRRMKTLRHPNLLPYLDGLELPTKYYIVTECVVPLVVDLEKGAPQKEVSLSWGLAQVLEALRFLNTDCKLLHGTVGLNSIFVTASGDWKLGSFLLVSDLQSLTPFKDCCEEILDNKYKPPEVRKKAWPVLQQGPVHAVDSWLVGCLLYELFNGSLQRSEELQNTNNIPKALVPCYQKMFSSDGKKRIEMGAVLVCKYFDNNIVRTCRFLENIALKEPTQKDAFFKELPALLDSFPQNLCTKKILPSLLQAINYGYANARALVSLLKIGKHLSADEYAAQVIPSIVKWFTGNDKELKANLLENMESFAEHLSPQIVNDNIFPCVALGFSDPAPKLRELTIRSVVYLAPKLNASTLNTQAMQYFAKLQMDREPLIRTNTTICLGRISRFLSDSTRKKVLVVAFSRALRDPFPPARVSALMAFAATVDYYDADDTAKRIVPSISVLTVDPEKRVRETALQAIHTFINKLEKASQMAGDAPLPEDEPATSSHEKIFSWAFDSLSKKIYGEEPVKPTTKTTAPPISNNSLPSGPTSPTIPTQTPNAAVSSLAADSEGGWSDDDTDEEDSWGKVSSKEDEEKDDRLASRSHTTSTLKLSAKSSILALPTAEEEDGGWGDGDAWDSTDGVDSWGDNTLSSPSLPSTSSTTASSSAFSANNSASRSGGTARGGSSSGDGWGWDGDGDEEDGNGGSGGDGWGDDDDWIFEEPTRSGSGGVPRQANKLEQARLAKQRKKTNKKD
ncbi:Nuclear aminoacylation-dependent tRNA export pathway component [Balamuthia mandrillaris]